MIGKTIGYHRILEELGRGGMGVIYKAEQIALGRTVAMKVLPERLTSESSFVHRFLNEARAIAALNHPNIVQIYDVGKDGKTYYYTMQLIEGTTVDELLNERGTLPLDHAIKIVARVANALRYTHRRRIVHRDIKSSNIMIDELGGVKLTDFGLALQESTRRVTVDGGIVGTPEYMSPEQASGETATKKSDIYSLGVVFYELLTGRVPFEASTPLGVIKKIQTEEPVPPRAIDSGIPVGIEAIILKMMAKNPKRRYGNCRAIIADLKRYLSGKTIPSSLSDIFSKRYISARTVASLLLVALIGGIGFYLLRSVDSPPIPPYPDLAKIFEEQSKKILAAMLEANAENARLAMEHARAETGIALITPLIKPTEFLEDFAQIKSLEMTGHSVIVQGLIRGDTRVNRLKQLAMLRKNLEEYVTKVSITSVAETDEGLLFRIELQSPSDLLAYVWSQPGVRVHPRSVQLWQTAENERQKADALHGEKEYESAIKSYLTASELYARVQQAPTNMPSMEAQQASPSTPAPEASPPPGAQLAELEISLASLENELSVLQVRSFDDTVVLKNAKEIKCEIISETPTGVRIRTRRATLNIPRKQIRFLMRAAPEERENLRLEIKKIQKERDRLKELIAEELRWPDIKVKSVFDPARSGSFIAILEVNGQRRFVKEGEVFDGFEVSQIDGVRKCLTIVARNSGKTTEYCVEEEGAG